MTDMKSSASLSMIKCIEASKVTITILIDHVLKLSSHVKTGGN